MNTIKTSALGVLALAAGMAGANATTTLYINGSTAFRSNAVPAIESLLSSYSEIYAGSSDTGQDAAIYSGVAASGITGVTAGTTIIIKTAWTGSESGIQAT